MSTQPSEWSPAGEPLPGSGKAAAWPWQSWLRRPRGIGTNSALRMIVAAGTRVWALIESRRVAHGSRRLRVLETIGMGEKRFVAIVQVEEAQFLIGGGSGGVSFLARLDGQLGFAAVLDEQAAQASTRPMARADRQDAVHESIPEAW